MGHPGSPSELRGAGGRRRWGLDGRTAFSSVSVGRPRPNVRSRLWHRPAAVGYTLASAHRTTGTGLCQIDPRCQRADRPSPTRGRSTWTRGMLLVNSSSSRRILVASLSVAALLLGVLVAVAGFSLAADWL